MQPERQIEPDGAAVDVFALPTDEASLEAILRELFVDHWEDITFGPIIQGAAWEMKAARVPDKFGMLDGYLTIGFGVPHFHICIGEHKGTRASPVLPNSRIIVAPRRPSFTAASAATARRCRGGCGCSMATASSRSPCCFPTRFSTPTTRSDGRLTGLGSRCGTACARNGSALPSPIRSTGPAKVSSRLTSGTKETAMQYLNASLAVGWRHHLWLVLLIAGSLLFTLGIACVVPFAAFGAIAAMTLPRRDALLLTLALWLINQIVGFAILHYPWDAMTLTWGAILAAIAVLSTVAAQATIRRHSLVTTAVASFATAFAVYEGGLYLVSATVMGGTENFAAAIVVQILAINAGAFAALLAAALLMAATQGMLRSRVGRAPGTI